MAQDERPTIRCFLSYARKDNDAFPGVADKIRAAIEGQYPAETGVAVEVFYDRESLPGGQNWREWIKQSIQGASIFVPIVTMQYFDSQACRDELFAFHDSAEVLGVTDLILPLILAGISHISEDSPRREIQIIAGLQYNAIDEAWRAGDDSPEMRERVGKLIKDMATSQKRAEAHLARVAEREGGVASRASNNTESADDDEERDALALAEDFNAVAETTTNAIKSLQEFTQSAVASTSGTDMKKLSAQQQRSALLRISHEVAEPAWAFHRDAKSFNDAVTRADFNLRGIVSELAGLADNGVADDLRRRLTGPMGQLENMDSALEQLESMSSMLMTLSIMSVSLRKALKPAIDGLRLVRSGLSVGTAWRELSQLQA